MVPVEDVGIDGCCWTVIGLGIVEAHEVEVGGVTFECTQVTGVVMGWWVGPSQPAAAFAIITGWSRGNAQLEGDGAGTGTVDDRTRVIWSHGVVSDGRLVESPHRP